MCVIAIIHVYYFYQLKICVILLLLLLLIMHTHTHTHNDALLSGQTVNELSNNLLDSLDIGSSNGSIIPRLVAFLYCLSSSKKIINIFLFFDTLHMQNVCIML